MASSDSTISNTLRKAHRLWDGFVQQLGIGQGRPVTVANYRGFGRPDYLYLKGRVLRDKTIVRRENDTVLRNLVNNYKRFNSREIPGANLRIHWGGQQFDLQSDAEGYFQLEEQFNPPVDFSKKQLWQQAQIEVLSVPKDTKAYFQTYTDVLLPQKAKYGIITDIDDTILQTDVTSRFKLRAMYWTFLKNAGSRRAFQQVSAFFQALQLGPNSKGRNPFFYVSNSPWNLYDLLAEFLSLNLMPKGPILLRDFGLAYGEHPEAYRGHKLTQIERIMQTYPELPFVLVGDSGERDIDNYLTIAREYPNRVRAIYIRDVKNRKRTRRVEGIIEQTTDVDVCLVDSYDKAATHAIEQGLIQLRDFERFRQ